MRNVSRGPLPNALRKHKKKWTDKLLAEIKKSKRTGEKVPDKYYDKYKHDDVKRELERMYGDGVFCYCCYCESIINDVSYEHIEHRMPKNKTNDKYPKKAFDWQNLHLSCGKCNIKKGIQFDEKYPILDAAKDPIKEHLGYAVSDTGEGVYRDALTKRGITTEKHADLNRETLLKARLKVYHVTMKAIKEIKLVDNESRVYTQIKMLRNMSKKEEHGSLIGYLLDDWGIGIV